MSLRLYDAHNHLQDERFGGRQSELLAACAEMGVAAMVVNGSGEADWPQVLALARQFGRDMFHRFPSPSEKAGNGVEPVPTKRETTPSPQIIPSYGYHPWYVHERTTDWLKNLTHFLDEVPSAVGEIGLDRWKPDLPYDDQEEVFIAQLRLAAERNLPVSIHCLQAWGRMLEILQREPRPARGFLLHSYGGSKEMVMPFADLGAYFSLPGYYAHERKVKQRETFQHIPAERLLIETDAPDQLLPDDPSSVFKVPNSSLSQVPLHPLTDVATRKALNHPANLAAVYAFAVELRRVAMDELAAQVEVNFRRLFGGL